MGEASTFRKKVQDNYSSLMAGEGSGFSEKYAHRIEKMYDRYLKRWISRERDISILDVGCGKGVLLYIFKKKGYGNIRGVDISKEQVRLAKQVVNDVVEEDAVVYLKQHADSFDLILGMDIVEHLRKEEVLDFLEACYESLKPNGRLILQTPNAESPWGTACMYGDLTHEVFFTPLWLKRLLEFAGFRDVKFRAAGPVVHGFISAIRFIMWKFIWCTLALWNLAEKGDIGSGTYTRVFIISGVKGV